MVCLIITTRYSLAYRPTIMVVIMRPPWWRKRVRFIRFVIGVIVFRPNRAICYQNWIPLSMSWIEQRWYKLGSTKQICVTKASLAHYKPWTLLILCVWSNTIVLFCTPRATPMGTILTILIQILFYVPKTLTHHKSVVKMGVTQIIKEQGMSIWQPVSPIVPKNNYTS